MTKFVTRVAVYHYVVQGTSPAEPLAALHITEVQEANDPDELDTTTPRYGFTLHDANGKQVASIEPGWYSAATAVVGAFLAGYVGDNPNFKALWEKLPDFGLAPVHMAASIIRPPAEVD